MIKKQQKWIALLVVCTFLWLMQLSTMPMAASGQTGVASAEQGPDYYESVSQKAATTKKKSILPIILIGVGLLTVTAVVLFLVVLNKYDITGSWQMTYTWQGGSPGTVTLTFTGNKKSGTFVAPDNSGTYTVDGKNVTFTFSAHGSVYTGTFTDKKSMSGTMASGGGTLSGIWTAIKGADATSFNAPMATHSSGNMDEAGNRI